MATLAPPAGPPFYIPPWHVHWASHIKWIVVAGIVAVTSLAIWHKYIAHRDQADHDQAVVAHERVQADTQAVAQANQQVAALQAQVAQQTQQINSLRQEVSNAIATRNTATTARQQAESTDPLSVVASRWAGLVRAADGDIRVGGDGNVIATPAASRLTAQTLEAGATAEANYADADRLNMGLGKQVDGLNALVASERDSAAKTQVLLVAEREQAKADLKTCKDDGAKRGRRGFWRGLAVGAGAVGALALRFL